MQKRLGGLLLLLCVVHAAAHGARADRFVYKGPSAEEVPVEARLVTSQGGVSVLELADGQYRLVPDGAIVSRQIAEGPEPLSADEVAQSLEGQFTPERFRAFVKEPYVLGLVLGSPLPKNLDARSRNFLQRAHAFLKNVEAAFAAFVKEARIAARAPTHPLVVLIFESDADFERYAAEATGGRGLSAGRISGFYSGLTNYLAVRLAECRTFDVPLHEAIHQQVYNRGVFRRLAPVPHWFDEGIATGFEANEGKVYIGPSKVSPRYARQVLAARDVSFEQILKDDSVFTGDVLAGEAYGRAWLLHWYLVTKHRNAYGKYVRLLAGKQPLARDDADQKLAEFTQTFGKQPAQIEEEFRTVLEAAVKKQRVVLNPELPAGASLTHEGAGEAQVDAVSRIDEGGRMEVRGKLTNTSPIRPMAFHVSVETNAGTYAEWHVPLLDIGKSTTLPQQSVTKLMQGGRGGPARTFRVRIRSVAPDSAEADEWRKGNLPIPVFSGQALF